MVNDTLELKVFLNRSKLRQEILKKLNEGEQIATFLSKDLKKHRSVISRVLLDLTQKGLAECLNQEAGNYRRYKITQKGKDILKELDL